MSEVRPGGDGGEDAPAAPEASPEVTELARRVASTAALIRDVAIATVVLGLVGVFLVQPFRVDGTSMEPLLQDRERILVNKLAYRVGEPQRFDVVIVRPRDGRTLVKRIVALPGEVVEIRDGHVHVDGRALDEPHVAVEHATLETLGPHLLGPDEYFVLGDNRAVSLDSRSFGPVRRRRLRGRAQFRYWPVAEAGSLPHAQDRGEGPGDGAS